MLSVQRYHSVSGLLQAWETWWTREIQTSRAVYKPMNQGDTGCSVSVRNPWGCYPGGAELFLPHCSISSCKLISVEIHFPTEIQVQSLLRWQALEMDARGNFLGREKACKRKTLQSRTKSSRLLWKGCFLGQELACRSGFCARCPPCKDFGGLELATAQNLCQNFLWVGEWSLFFPSALPL